MVAESYLLPLVLLVAIACIVPFVWRRTTRRERLRERRLARIEGNVAAINRELDGFLMRRVHDVGDGNRARGSSNDGAPNG